MSEVTPENTQNSEAASPSAQAMIETAARVAPPADSTTTQRAMNVVAAADVQRDAITRSFNEKKALVNQAVVQQKELAMQQVKAAKLNHTAHSQPPMNADAQQASENLARMAQSARFSPDGAPEDASPNHVVNQEASFEETRPDTGNSPTPVTSYEHPAAPASQVSPSAPPVQSAGTPQPRPAAPVPQYSQPAPPPTVTAAAPQVTGAPIAEEIALTLRSIISQEIEKQLQALLAAYTDNNAPSQNPPQA